MSKLFLLFFFFFHFCWSIIYKALTCITNVTNFWHLIMHLFFKKWRNITSLLACLLLYLLAYKFPNCVDTFITAVYHNIKNSLAKPVLKNNLTKSERKALKNMQQWDGIVVVDNGCRRLHQGSQQTNKSYKRNCTPKKLKLLSILIKN